LLGKPPPISPLNVYVGLMGIGRGEMVLSVRLVAARAHVVQFLADLQDYEKLDLSSHKAANTLEKELRGKLKGAFTRWVGTEENPNARE
jgi:hypothetical protein